MVPLFTMNILMLVIGIGINISFADYFANKDSLEMFLLLWDE